MAEKLTNGTFDSSLTGWSKWGASNNMFIYDPTGAHHDGGAAKAQNVGAAYSTVRYAMYQTISLTDTDSIDTATMDAWVQYNDAWPAANSEVSKSWIKFWIQLKDPQGNWHTARYNKYYFSSLTSVNFLSDEDVSGMLAEGGDGTWYVVLTCDIYRANLSTGWFVGWFDDLSLDVVIEEGDTTSTSISLDISTSHGAQHSKSTITTISLDVNTKGVGVAATNYSYYLADIDGNVYEYSGDYVADGSKTIRSSWQSKTTDFADQLPAAIDKDKVVEKVVLTYVDKSADTNVTMYVSNDGGVTWKSQMKTLGSGDGMVKSADYFFRISGQYFDFKIEHSSTDKDFQWIELKVFGRVKGTQIEES